MAMFNDLYQLHQYLKQRGIRVSIETFFDDQLAKAQSLPPKARDLMLAILNRHPNFPDNHGFYQSQPVYQFAANIIIQNETDGKPFWSQADFNALWNQGVLHEAWRLPAERFWGELPIEEKLSLIQQFATDWVFHEATLIDLVEYSDVYFYFGFFELLSRFFATAIDAGEQPIIQKIRETIRKQALEGIVATNLIKASLSCGQPNFWDDIAQLLVAGQNQEAIRQAVLKAIPDARPEARILLLETILENKIERFTSAAFELNQWFRLPLAEGLVVDEKNMESQLRMALQFLKMPQIDIEKITHSENLTETYFALWALRIRHDLRLSDVSTKLMQQADPEKKAMALYNMLPRIAEGFEFAIEYLQEKEWAVRWNLYKHFENYFGEKFPYLKESWTFFENLINDIPKTSLHNPQPSFTWNHFRFEIVEVLNYWIYRLAAQSGRYMDLLPYRKRMDANQRSSIFFGHFQKAFDLINQGRSAEFQPNPEERQWILETIQDVSANVSANGFTLYAVLKPLPEELDVLYQILTRKTESVRKNALGILFKLPKDQLKPCIETLLGKSDEDQQLAGLDLLQQLKNQRSLPDFIKEQALAFSKRPNIGTKAQLILEDLLDESIVYDAANGYGIYDPAKARITPVLQKPEKGFFVEQMLGKPMLGLSISLEKLEDELRKLDALFTTYENYTYEIENWDGSTQTVLLSAPYFQRKKQFNYEPSFEESLASLPLAEVWLQWLEESGLNAMDRYLLTNHQTHYPFYPGHTLPEWLTSLVKNYTQNYINRLLFENQLGLKYPNHCITLLDYLRHDAAIIEQIQQMQIDAAAHYFASIPPEFLHEKYIFHAENPGYLVTWREVWAGPYNQIQQWEYSNDQEGATRAERLPEPMFRQYWSALYWYYCTLSSEQLAQNSTFCQPPTLGRAYELQLIGKDEAFDIILSAGILNQLFYAAPAVEKRLFETYPVFNIFYAEAVPQFLGIELERGDTPTSVSDFVAFFKKIEGVRYFVQIVKGLGNDSLHRGYSYGGQSKKMQFSRLLKNSYPAATDAYESFQKALDEVHFLEKRLLEVSLYAPQWLPWMAQYLQWPGLESAAWCLHAHGTTYLDAQKETELSKYTNIPVKDFKYGAVDINWFRQAFATLGAARWEMLYSAAHYIAQNQGYIRARLYADAILGNLSLDACKQYITEKRSKDYIIALGLIPINPENSAQDILDRYLFLQDFLDEGKISFPTRQSGEKRACDISIENLARNAGYLSPVRLLWAMEIRSLHELMARAKTVAIDGYTVALQASSLGTVKVVAEKDGKTWSSLPETIKTNPIVLELQETKNNLNKQRKRIFYELEEAMIMGDEFLYSELENLMTHPVIQPLLSRLVLISGSLTGFLSDSGYLIRPGGQQTELDKTVSIRIAHPYDLEKTGEWPAYQKAAFEQKLVQPFKQIFRELYQPNDQEIHSIGSSMRYAGYKVQPTQAGGLFRSHGWTASYYEGMQKTYHRHRLVATVEAYADWLNPGSSSLPVEVHAVRFHRQLTYEPIAVKDILPAIFSEIMRDIDLVVTVAHAAGVVIMAGQPVIAMRAVIVQQTARLYTFTGVQIDEEKVHVLAKDGTNYTVHLNNGDVYRGESDKVEIRPENLRKKVYLPFAEEDEVVEEVIRKVVYLMQ